MSTSSPTPLRRSTRTASTIAASVISETQRVRPYTHRSTTPAAVSNTTVDATPARPYSSAAAHSVPTSGDEGASSPTTPVKRGRGRPKGSFKKRGVSKSRSKSRPRASASAAPTRVRRRVVEDEQDGASIDVDEMDGAAPPGSEGEGVLWRWEYAPDVREQIRRLGAGVWPVVCIGMMLLTVLIAAIADPTMIPSMEINKPPRELRRFPRSTSKSATARYARSLPPRNNGTVQSGVWDAGFSGYFEIIG
ncbi:hypothetical protein HK104_002163, partial [Borealophlyctis nickersoniae]